MVGALIEHALYIKPGPRWNGEEMAHQGTDVTRATPHLSRKNTSSSNTATTTASANPNNIAPCRRQNGFLRLRLQLMLLSRRTRVPPEGIAAPGALHLVVFVLPAAAEDARVASAR
jgi:hypothetical protein